MKLQGKVALVTGGGTGIGGAIARTLALNGARVAIASRSPERLEAAARQSKDLDLLPLRMDVRNKEEVRRGVDRVMEDWGAIHIVVNNAGVSGRNPIDDEDDSRWHAIVETNLTGAYLVTKAALRGMKDQSGGRILNVSSVLGKFGVPGYTAYCASKHGLIGFTRALALELAPRGVTVNAICPGWVDTEMARQGMRESATAQGITVEEFERQAIGAVPIRRYIALEEVAELALYLASPAAGGITGQAINICGGQTMV